MAGGVVVPEKTDFHGWLEVPPDEAGWMPCSGAERITIILDLLSRSGLFGAVGSGHMGQALCWREVKAGRGRCKDRRDGPQVISVSR
ncbi:hypothetical protein BaRGS_00010168 [Batillaria attramentaria]|uniref:Uncharacterized protein n=1 Tax=Batillaria attramentaria TaxID=370345 RepID=A0ABD0LGZ5_9CAEN